MKRKVKKKDKKNYLPSFLSCLAFQPMQTRITLRSKKGNTNETYAFFLLVKKRFPV